MPFCFSSLLSYKLTLTLKVGIYLIILCVYFTSFLSLFLSFLFFFLSFFLFFFFFSFLYFYTFSVSFKSSFSLELRRMEKLTSSSFDLLLLTHLLLTMKGCTLRLFWRCFYVIGCFSIVFTTITGFPNICGRDRRSCVLDRK